jgi:hypothetical protein
MQYQDKLGNKSNLNVVVSNLKAFDASIIGIYVLAVLS